MHSEGPQPRPGSIPEPSFPAHEIGPNHEGTAATRGGFRLPLWLLTIVAGLIAGVLSGLASEVIGKAIPFVVVYPSGYGKMGGRDRDDAHSRALIRAERTVERRKAASGYGLLGLLLGGSLGLVGGLAAGSPQSGLKGGVLGSAIGAAAGAGLSWVIVPLFFRYQEPETSSLLAVFLTHAGIFAGVGAAAGVALGLGLGDWQALGRAFFGGILGALVGTFLFETVTSLAFPLMLTFQPVPTEQLARHLAHWCIAICTALAVGFAAGGLPSRQAIT